MHKQLVRRQDQVIIGLFAKAKNKNAKQDCSFWAKHKEEMKWGERGSALYLKMSCSFNITTCQGFRFLQSREDLWSRGRCISSQRSLTLWTSYIDVYISILNGSNWQDWRATHNMTKGFFPAQWRVFALSRYEQRVHTDTYSNRKRELKDMIDCNIQHTSQPK